MCSFSHLVWLLALWFVSKYIWWNRWFFISSVICQLFAIFKFVFYIKYVARFILFYFLEVVYVNYWMTENWKSILSRLWSLSRSPALSLTCAICSNRNQPKRLTPNEWRNPIPILCSGKRTEALLLKSVTLEVRRVIAKEAPINPIPAL